MARRCGALTRNGTQRPTRTATTLPALRRSAAYNRGAARGGGANNTASPRPAPPGMPADRGERGRGEAKRRVLRVPSRLEQTAADGERRREEDGGVCGEKRKEERKEGRGARRGGRNGKRESECAGLVFAAFQKRECCARR